MKTCPFMSNLFFLFRLPKLFFTEIKIEIECRHNCIQIYHNDLKLLKNNCILTLHCKLYTADIQGWITGGMGPQAPNPLSSRMGGGGLGRPCKNCSKVHFFFWKDIYEIKKNQKKFILGYFFRCRRKKTWFFGHFWTLLIFIVLNHFGNPR